MTCKTCCTYCMFVGGIIALVATVSLVVLWPYLFHKILNEQLTLSPNSESFEMWADVPIPMYMEIYIYNFTNSEEVAANHSIKPRLQELGPYVFRERNTKVNLTWFDDNSTVTFFQNKTWHFEPDMSNGSLSDEVTTINMILATLGHALKGTSAFTMGILNLLFTGLEQNIYIRKTAGELLFDGYEDVLLDLAKNLSSLNLPLNISGIDIPYDRVGFFYGRNGTETYDGEFNMFTGADDINKLGLLNTWNRQNKTHFFGDGCNEIGGSTGDLWPPRTEVDNINLFANDICGILKLKQDGHRTVEGISGTLFVGDDTLFDNGWNYPETACFCSGDQSTCKPAGVRDISLCQFGAPALISFPHFYLADPSYNDAIDAQPPNRERDEFRLVLEQNVGMPLLVRGQLQMNLFIEHIPGLSIVNNRIPEIVVPMMWFRQEVRLTAEYASMARMILNLPMGVNIALYCLLGLSIVAIITAIALIAVRRLRGDPERQLLVADAETEAETN